MADPSAPSPVDPAAPTAAEVWEWLAACLDCGKPHAYRPPQTACAKCPDCMHPGGHWTWASPDDGHTYRPRGPHVERLAQLRREWEESRG